MKRFLLSIVFAVFGTAVMACPDYGLVPVEQIRTTGADLWTPNRYNVIAGGDRNLSRCTHIDWQNHPGTANGWVIEEADFSIRIDQLLGYQLEFRVESDCDTVLVVNTAAANWYYDDDDGDGMNAKILLTKPAANGVYDVWIGTYDDFDCNAQLVLETF